MSPDLVPNGFLTFTSGATFAPALVGVFISGTAAATLTLTDSYGKAITFTSVPAGRTLQGRITSCVFSAGVPVGLVA